MKTSRYPVKDAIVSCAATALIIGSSAAMAAGTLNVTNWAEYIAEDTISNFEKEFDVKVTYDVYDSSEATKPNCWPVVLAMMSLATPVPMPAV